ncbi:hypothetical protein [Streptomyces sp. NPDC002853]
MSFVAWRFAEPHEDFRGVFDAVIRETPTAIEWTLKVTRHWMIAPTRLIQQPGPDGTTFNEAMLRITEEDQAFCAASRDDLAVILEALESASI